MSHQAHAEGTAQVRAVSSQQARSYCRSMTSAEPVGDTQTEGHMMPLTSPREKPGPRDTEDAALLSCQQWPRDRCCQHTSRLSEGLPVLEQKGFFLPDESAYPGLPTAHSEATPKANRLGKANSERTVTSPTSAGSLAETL